MHWLKVVRRKLNIEVVEHELEADLRGVICSAFGVGGFEYSVFEGTPSVHRKITIQVWRGERILGYVKVTRSEEVGRLFEREASFLKYVNSQRSTVNGQRSTVNITPFGRDFCSAQHSTSKLDSAFAYRKKSTVNGQQGAMRKLYFLSRDSYVLMKGVEQLKDCFPDVELHYLFLSRRSLFLPYLACDVSAEQMLSVMDKNSLYGKKVDGLLALLATNRDELRQWNIEFDYSKICNRADEAGFLDKIFNGGYVSVLKERASEAKELLVKYFEQEGLLSGDSCDMVDVGWLGTSRLMVNKILDSVGARRVRFFYYGVRGDVFGEECGEYASYFQAGELITTATALIENYFSASPYPTTVGYAKSSESVIPLFPDGEEFCDTEITKANCDAVALLTKWVCEAGFTEEKLRAWACRQMQDVVALSKKIDLSPFEVTSDFDSDSFVRRMTVKELFHFVCLGANITAFDKASLCLSVGYRYMNVLWRLHSWSGRFRRFLYLRLKHNR